MNYERPIERVLDDWLVLGPTELPDRVFDAALDEIDRTEQRRGWPRWRGIRMSESVKILATAAAVLAIVIGGGLLARVVGPPVDRAQVAASAAPIIPTRPMATFESRLFRYTVSYPAEWKVSDPLGDIVKFEGSRGGPLFEVYVTPATRGLASGGLWWPWGGTFPVGGGDLDELATAAVANLEADGLTVVSDRPAALGGLPARRIEIDEVETDSATPVTVILAHRGQLFHAVIYYGPLGAPEIDDFVGWFAFTDAPAPTP